MKKRIYIFLLAFLLILGIPNITKAQEAETAGTASEVSRGEESETAETEEEAEDSLLAQDETVTSDDLGIEDQTVLPGSVFYPFKNMWRGFRSAFAFDPIKKAELKLQHANERIIEAQQIAEIAGDEKALEKLEDAMENYEKDLAKVKQAIERVEERESAKIDKFTEKFVDSQIKSQKVIQKIQEKAPEKALGSFLQARANAARHFGEALAKVAPEEKITNAIEAALEAQDGSEFKDLKHLGIIKELKQGLPDEVKKHFEAVEEKVLTRAGEKLKNIQGEKKEAVKEYLEKMKGHEVNQFKILDDLKWKADLPRDFIEDLSGLEDKIQARIERKMKRFEDEEVKKHFFRPFEGGELENARALEKVFDKMSEENQEALKEAREKAREALKERFLEKNDERKDEDERRKRLLKKVGDKSDPFTLSIMAEIEEGLDEDEKEKIKEFQEKAFQEFKRHFEDEKENFLEIFSSHDPKSLKRLEELREHAPAEALSGIEQAIERHAQKIERHLEKLDDPEEQQRFKRKIQEGGASEAIIKRNPKLKELIEHREERKEKRLEFGEEVKSKSPAQAPRDLPPRKLKAIKEGNYREDMDYLKEEIEGVEKDIQESLKKFKAEIKDDFREKRDAREDLFEERKEARKKIFEEQKEEMKEKQEELKESLEQKREKRKEAFGEIEGGLKEMKKEIFRESIFPPKPIQNTAPRIDTNTQDSVKIPPQKAPALKQAIPESLTQE